MTGRPLVAVVYGTGSAGPAMIARAARDVCDVLFVCDAATPGVEKVIAGMRHRFRVCDITGLDARSTRDMLRREQPSGITTYSDHCLVRTAELAAALGLRYHPPGIAETVVDKFAQRAALRGAGLDDTPSTVAYHPAVPRGANRLRLIRGLDEVRE